MKKEMLLLVLFISLIPLIAAEIRCPNDSEPIWSQKEILQGSVKPLNTLNIGVGISDEIAAKGRAAALVFVEAELLTLTNFSNSINVYYTDSKHTLQLLNASDDHAKIRVNGVITEIDKWEYQKQAKLNIVLISSKSDDSTGHPNTVLMASPIALSLSNDETNYQIVSIGNTTHYIELISAYDDRAIVKVANCKNTNITDQKKIEDKLPPVINDTASSNLNNSLNQLNKSQGSGLFSRIKEFFKMLFRRKAN